MAKKTLIQLKADCKKAQLKLNQLRQEVEDMETQLTLPKLKEQFEGKFFKYQNSAGGDNRCWLYSFCKQVVNGNYAMMDRFESTPYENKFDVDVKEGLFIFEREISEKEYMKALTDFLSKVQLMRSNVINNSL